MAAILFPVFGQAKIAAQRTACLANIKKSSTAVLLYSGDYDDKFPPAAAWMEVGKPYLPTGPSPFHCPLVTDGHGFAMNDALSKKVTSQIAAPETTILLFETEDESFNAHGKPPSPGTDGPRHGSRSIAFANGAAKSWKNGRK